MKKLLINLLAIILINSSIWAQELQPEKHRMIILADMGNEPDEEQQMVHMLMCSNEFDVVGLIAVTGKFLNPNSNKPEKQKLYPELFTKLIEGYEKVHTNLKIHAPDYPEPDYLRSLVVIGQKGYGMDDVGDGKTSPGSELIVKELKKDDNRPLYIVVNAGSNTLAQALSDLKTSSTQKQMNEYIAKIRVFENGAQDNAGAWICSQFPSVHWIRSNYQTYCYAGPSIDGGFNNKGKSSDLGPHTWKPYAYNGIGQHQWLLEHIIGGHGPFGNYYPIRQFKKGGISFMEGGGTIPFLALVNKGLYDINHPEWGGWSGRYSREKKENYWSKHQSVKVDEEKYAPFMCYVEEPDSWTDLETGEEYIDNLFVPVWRWRKAFLNDFMCRMDWCKQTFENANHHPVAVVNGDKTNNILIMDVKTGDMLSFDASKSFDPDEDKLQYNWFYYPEAGTYDGDLIVTTPARSSVRLTIPKDAKGQELHVILEISDDNKIGSLYDYRRIVMKVK